MPGRKGWVVAHGSRASKLRTRLSRGIITLQVPQNLILELGGQAEAPIGP
jgi:hypothetical protein